MSSLLEGARRRIPEPLKPALRRIYYPLRRALLRTWYAGDGVECPCCGGRYRSFRAFSERPDVQCPDCDSLERHRLLWVYLEDKGYLAGTPIRVLHFAPEQALSRRLRRLPHVCYVTADLASPLAEVRMDVTDTGLDDGSFDFIICSHVLEHVEDDRRAIAELYRILAPGGRAIVMCPVQQGRATTFEDPTVTDPAERERLFWQHDHVRIYGADLADRLAEVGFEVRVENYVEELDAQRVERCRLRSGHRWGPDEVYDCLKPPR